MRSTARWQRPTGATSTATWSCTTRRWCCTASPEPIDFEGAKEFYGTLLGALSDPHLTIDDALQEGDKVAVRYTLSGTHTGELMGVPATGRSVVLTGQSIFRFNGAKAVERRQAADMLGLLVQLGAIPAPV